MNIGELARAADTKAETIRYYERIGDGRLRGKLPGLTQHGLTPGVLPHCSPLPRQIVPFAPGATAWRAVTGWLPGYEPPPRPYAIPRASQGPDMPAPKAAYRITRADKASIRFPDRLARVDAAVAPGLGLPQNGAIGRGFAQSIEH